MDILDPDVSYSEPTTIRDRAILAIWIILCICLGLGGLLFAVSIPASAAEINPSVDTIPFQCRFEYTKWLCDDKAGPAGAKGINGTPGTPGAGNFSAIYYNASNFTAYQNTTLIFGNITTGNNTINSNYTVIQGASFYNTTGINESYAYLPGRAEGQKLAGSSTTTGNLTLTPRSSFTSFGNLHLNPYGGFLVIGNYTSAEAGPAGTSNTIFGSGSTVYFARSDNARFGKIYDNLDGMWIASSATGNDPLYLSSGSKSSYIIFVGGTDTTNETMRIITNGVRGGNVSIGTTSPTAQFQTTGTVRLQLFGAGTLNTDANGYLYTSSDTKLKTDITPYTGSVSKVKQIQPINFKFAKDSGYDTVNTYTGFSAQNIQQAMPEAVSVKDDVIFEYVTTKDAEGRNVTTTKETKTGTQTLSISDRAIIAALVNALKEEDAKVQALEARIAVLESKVKP